MMLNGESKMQTRKASGYMEISTKVTIAGVELKNPVMTASGTFGSLTCPGREILLPALRRPAGA